MPRDYHLLHQDNMLGEINIHQDLLSIMPSALSRKRALKAGSEQQVEMTDPKGPEGCILCNPKLKPPSSSPIEELIPGRVASFENDFPYLPGDQQVLFLWHKELAKREKYLHKYKLKDFRRRELYWLLKGCIKRGLSFDIPKENYDLMRMVVGFNIGKLAGQSISHFHAQYGWEVVLDRRQITKKQLELYFDELENKQLILYSNDRIKLVVPWTPKGQFAIELYFIDKYDLSDLDDKDMKIFACVGRQLIKKYLSLGIQNLNIVFWNSPHGRKIEPLIAHFVPRVNMSALYEIRGVNVVDTPPETIAEEFKRQGKKDEISINWIELFNDVEKYDPDAEFEELLRKQKTNKK